MKTLGHILDHDGGISSCFKATTAAMTRAFLGNLDKGLKRASKRAKLRFLESCILAIGRYRFPRWPFQKVYADCLNRLQRRFLAITFDIRPLLGESWEDYAHRRRRETQALAQSSGLWSNAWASALSKWNAHVHRDHDRQTWTPKILGWRDPWWLSMQRFLKSHGNESRLGTRVVRGHPKPRWQESLQSLTVPAS